MAISRAEVEKVSLLARLLLSDGELDKMTAEMTRILEYIDLLGEVDTERVEPMAHAVEIADVFRPDASRPSLDRCTALASAADRDDECYRVPAVLGDG